MQISPKALDFDTLRIINRARCEVDFKHALSLWSCSEWGNATAGEVGEACNIAKKILRLDKPTKARNREGISRADFVEALADELADAIIYIDLWAASEHIDLGEAVRKKFNQDSLEKGSEARL